MSAPHARGPRYRQLPLWRDAQRMLLEVEQAVRAFPRYHKYSLGLALRDAGRLAPAAAGIDFLGYIVRADYLLVRRRVIGHLHDRLARLGRGMARKNGVLACPPGQTDRLQAVLASYFGHLRHARSLRLQNEVFQRHGWLAHLLAPLGDGRLRRADRPASVSSLASQWRYFHQRYPGHALLMQVGNRWECALPEPIAARTLREGRAGGGTGLSQRPGLPPTRALSANQLRVLKRRLIQAGQPWCEVAENGYLRGGTKRRQLRAIWPAIPPPCPSARSTERRAPAGLAKTLEAQP